MLRHTTVGDAPSRARKPRRAPSPAAATAPRAAATDRRGGFEEDAARAVGELQTALARLIDAVPGGARRAVDLQRALDLDAALAWQAHRLTAGADPLRAVRVVPKAGAMARLLRAAHEAGLPAELVAGAETAYARFEAVVAAHAPDLRTFASIASSLRPDDGAALRRTRRDAFRASAAVWGVSVRCMLNCVVFHQRPTGEHDCMAIRGRVGLARLQRGALIGVYASSRTWSGDACPPDSDAKLPLDRCELLERYCSRPIPRIERLPVADGSTRDFVDIQGVGAASEVTLFWRNDSPAYMQGPPAPPHGGTVQVLEPAEVLVADLLVPRGWSDPGSASAWMTPESSRAPVGPRAPELPRLPFEGRLEHLGSRLEALRTPHAPAYHDIVAGELHARGWDVTAFDLYRCVVHYPVLHSAVHICVGGPKA